MGFGEGGVDNSEIGEDPGDFVFGGDKESNEDAARDVDSVREEEVVVGGDNVEESGEVEEEEESG